MSLLSAFDCLCRTIVFACHMWRHERCSLSEGCLSSADCQGAEGAHFHRAQLHQQLRLKPFRPVRGCAAVKSSQLPQSSLDESVGSPPSADCGDDSQGSATAQLRTTSGHYPAVRGNNNRSDGEHLLRGRWFSQRLCLRSGFSLYISNLDGPQLCNHAIDCFSFTWYDFRRQ